MPLSTLRKALRAAADPARAPAMQAYMKSAMPYHGVPAPLVRRICAAAFADATFSSASEWRAQVLDVWRGARYREERYAALHLAGHARALPYQTPAAMTLYEELVVTGAWWDFVDDIASHRIGPILKAYPGLMRRKMLSWSRSDHLWKRRSAILCQLGFRGDTDPELLQACLEPSLESREFFLQKAIGWALRQYARTDADAVRRYVRVNAARLQALSRREALKAIGE